MLQASFVLPAGHHKSHVRPPKHTRHSRYSVQESFVLPAGHIESRLRPPKHTRHAQSSVQESFLSSGHLESRLERSSTLAKAKSPFSTFQHRKILASTELPANVILSRILNHTSMLANFEISSAEEPGFRRIARECQTQSDLRPFKHTRHSRTSQHQRTSPSPDCQQTSSRSSLHKPSAH
jgi:hypothetical protein